MKDNKHFRNAAKMASLGMVLQMFMRIVTFGLNAFILRYVTKDVLGIINVRLILLYSTLQFITREPFRRAALSDSKNKNWQQIVNAIWLTIPVSIIFGLILSSVWIFLIHQPTSHASDYHLAVIFVSLSVIIEMPAEPLVIFGQLNNYLKSKLMIEALALSLRCFLMAIFIVYNPMEAIRIFAYSQLISSLIYSATYYTYFHFNLKNSENKTKEVKTISDFWPGKFKEKAYFDGSFLTLCWSFFMQTLVKQLLTEGEKFIMTFFNVLTFAEQGIYDVVNNLGSLAARFIFQPIEESAYLMFSQLIDRNIPHKEQVKNLKESSHILRNILKLMLIFGIIVIVFGYNYSRTLLLIYGGKILSGELALKLMRAHCVYILIIGINGISESFTFASMTSVEINLFNSKLVLLSVIFLTSAYFLTLFFGSIGFIYANCVNMCGRIAYSYVFMRRYFEKVKFKNPMSDLLPNIYVASTLTISFLALVYANNLLEPITIFDHVKYVTFGIGVLCTNLIIFYTEKDLMFFIKSNLKVKEK